MSLHGRPYSTLPKTFDPASISWSIRGKPVVLEWDSFNVTAPGGFGVLNAKAMPNRGVRVKCWQGSRVIGKKPNGEVAYEGKLQAPPKYVDDVAIFTAIGPQDVVNRYNERLPYQIRDASQWTELHSDPAKFSANSAKFDMAQKGNSVGIKVGGPDGASAQTYNNGDNQGYYLWVQGWDISRVAFTLRRSASRAGFDLRVRGSDDNFSAPTNITTFAMSTADGTAEDIAIATDYSVLVIDWNANSTTSPDATRFWCDDLRVGVITDADAFSTGEVAADVGNRCGYETATQGSINAMPLDWNGPATGLLDYLASVEDQTWMVMHSKKRGTYGKLYFRDWGRRTWHTRLGDWAEDNGLQMASLYDRVTTTYDNPPGVQQSKRNSVGDFNIKDPLPGETYDWPEPLHLEDPQPDSSMAEAVNQRALSRLTKLRVQGQVTVRYVSKGVPYDIWPGDLLELGDFQPKVPPQRIVAVTYNRDGSVVCSLDAETDTAALTDRLILRRLKRRNPRR
jgi:opacity protein-like surface antigen